MLKLLSANTTLAINLRRVHGQPLIYTVESLVKRAHGYLSEHDTAEASEKSFQATKLALSNYVKRLEEATQTEIVPKNIQSPWTYTKFRQVVLAIAKRVDKETAQEMMLGFESAYTFHTRGWCQNNLSVEEVRFSLPFVVRFCDIVEKELLINSEMAQYLKVNLFTMNSSN